MLERIGNVHKCKDECSVEKCGEVTKEGEVVIESLQIMVERERETDLFNQHLVQQKQLWLGIIRVSRETAAGSMTLRRRR